MYNILLSKVWLLNSSSVASASVEIYFKKHKSTKKILCRWKLYPVIQAKIATRKWEKQLPSKFYMFAIVLGAGSAEKSTTAIRVNIKSNGAGCSSRFDYFITQND